VQLPVAVTEPDAGSGIHVVFSAFLYHSKTCRFVVKMMLLM